MLIFTISGCSSVQTDCKSNNKMPLSVLALTEAIITNKKLSVGNLCTKLLNSSTGQGTSGIYFIIKEMLLIEYLKALPRVSQFLPKKEVTTFWTRYQEKTEDIL